VKNEEKLLKIQSYL